MKNFSILFMFTLLFGFQGITFCYFDNTKSWLKGKKDQIGDFGTRTKYKFDTKVRRKERLIEPRLDNKKEYIKYQIVEKNMSRSEAEKKYQRMLSTQNLALQEIKKKEQKRADLMLKKELAKDHAKGMQELRKKYELKKQKEAVEKKLKDQQEKERLQKIREETKQQKKKIEERLKRQKEAEVEKIFAEQRRLEEEKKRELEEKREKEEGRKKEVYQKKLAEVEKLERQHKKMKDELKKLRAEYRNHRDTYEKDKPGKKWEKTPGAKQLADLIDSQRPKEHAMRKALQREYKELKALSNEY